MRRILFEPRGEEGGDPPVADDKAPSPPPAAKTVAESDAKESDAAELVELRRSLQEEKAGRKKDQTRLSELEDENHQLKQLPKAEKKADASPAPWTFFD